MQGTPCHALFQPQPTCGQLLQDGGLEGGGLQLADLGGRDVLPSDGELGGQVGAGGGGGLDQLGAGAVGLAGVAEDEQY